MAVINDKELGVCITDDLMESMNYSREDADAWLESYGEKLVDAMWNGYTNFIQDHSYFKDEEADE